MASVHISKKTSSNAGLLNKSIIPGLYTKMLPILTVIAKDAHDLSRQQTVRAINNEERKTNGSYQNPAVPIQFQSYSPTTPILQFHGSCCNRS